MSGEHVHRTLAVRDRHHVCRHRALRSSGRANISLGVVEASHEESRLSLLVASTLSHSFGGARALDGVSLQLQAGERRAIIGTNGAGKTTLFNLINGQLAPSSGEIWILGIDATRLPVHRRAAIGLARTFQVTSLFPRLSVLHNLIVAGPARCAFPFHWFR